jgi:hypothetical protein
MIRIGNGQGFWGDSLEAPLEQIRGGPLDFLTLDYLAEVTMSILQKQRARDPRAGYARDFVSMIEQGARDIVDHGVKVIANAGGVNPGSCRDAVRAALAKQNLAGRLKIGVVTGDDILARIDELLDTGIFLKNLDTGEPLSLIRDRVQSANVYLGAFPIADALRQGADIVITGRCADAALSLAPMIVEFGWRGDQWDKLAGGTIAGHAIECGAQTTGGNSIVDWRDVSDFAGIGYPILEAEPDGSAVVTKHKGTGGRVSVAGVTEQLVYEIGDPSSYVTPDCVVDFTTARLENCGPDRVRLSGTRGRPATDTYKVSISYAWGWKAGGQLIYAWPDAEEKARLADRVLRDRLTRLGLQFDAIHTEFTGSDDRVLWRIAVRSQDKGAVERFTKEIAPLALNGPPVVTYVGGRPKVEEVVAYWPALIPKAAVQASVSVESG